MQTKQEIQERRLKFEKEKLRAEEKEGVKKIRGYPILFNVPGTPYRGSEWKEVIDPRALDDVDFSELRLLVDHDTGKLLARAGINLRYEIDDAGLFVEATLPNTTLANDTWELVRAGILDGMSFRFLADRWETDTDNKIDRILHITDVPEVSLITFPAYRATIAIATEGTPDEQRDEQNSDSESRENETRQRAEAELNLILSMIND